MCVCVCVCVCACVPYTILKYPTQKQTNTLVVCAYACVWYTMLWYPSQDFPARQKGEDEYGDGLTFYKLGPELESAMRMLQLEDSVVWPSGHSIRHGYGATAADSAHRHESLVHSKRAVSSIRSIGHDPYKVNIRNFIGSAPDNHYGTSLKLVAVLHDFHTCMQEDSFPQSLDAYRHMVFKSHSITFEAPYHWEQCPQALGYQKALKLHVAGSRSMTPRDLDDFVACISDDSGLVLGPYTFVKEGQALCFYSPPPPAKKIVKIAPCDLWVKKTEVQKQTHMGGRTSYRYEIQCLSMEVMQCGQKLGKLYQKFVSILLEDWVAGGLGRVTGLLSSSSIASRTAVQNVIRSWMTSLALASGVGSLRLQESLMEEANYLLEAMHNSRPLSASALTALRRRMPGVSVTHRVPLVMGRQGRFLGNCLQYMMSVFVAVQDGSRPNGSVNGINERGRSTPGQIRLDPIMTAMYRSLGLEQHEERPGAAEVTVCGTCGVWSCRGCRGVGENKRRKVALNPSFSRSVSSLASLNLDVKFGLAEPDEEPMPEPEVSCDDMRWASVPPIRDYMTMGHAQKGDSGTVAPEKPIVTPVVLPGHLRWLGLSFGSSSAGRVAADQVHLGLRSVGAGAAWDSGDKTRGHTVVSSASRQEYSAALKFSIKHVQLAGSAIRNVLASSESLTLNGMVDAHDVASETCIGKGMLYFGVEPGGTLQIHTRGHVDKYFHRFVFSYI